jgi:hypothetical protein
LRSRSIAGLVVVAISIFVGFPQTVFLATPAAGYINGAVIQVDRDRTAV